jgi:Uma2 family endonuclease
MAATTNISSTTQLMTWESFEKLPDGDGYHRELIEGELQILPPPKSGHTEVAYRILQALVSAAAVADARAFPEAGYKLSANPPSWVQPDVSVLRNARRKQTKHEDYFLGAPELAVEVVSPSESASDLDRKVDLMLTAGSLAVWVVYPEERRVRVFLPDGTSHRRVTDDTLSLPELLPGWELPVARLFED